MKIKEIGDGTVLGYNGYTFSFFYEGDNKFRVIQEIPASSEFEIQFEGEEPRERIIFYDGKIILTEQFTKISLQEVELYARLTNSQNGEKELAVTRDITRYVDLGIKNVEFSKSEDKLIFEICNNGNEPAIGSGKVDVMARANFVEGVGSDTAGWHGTFERNLFQITRFILSEKGV